MGEDAQGRAHSRSESRGGDKRLPRTRTGTPGEGHSRALLSMERGPGGATLRDPPRSRIDKFGDQGPGSFQSYVAQLKESGTPPKESKLQRSDGFCVGTPKSIRTMCEKSSGMGPMGQMASRSLPALSKGLT